MPSIRAIAASALLLIACDAPSTAPRFRAAGGTTPMRGGTLRFATYQQVRTLDPAFSYDEISTYAVHMLYDTLIGYEEATPDRPGSGLALEPHLASSWTVSEDGRTYRFTLRPGITFSDGQPVVAGDFEYAMERVLRTPESPYGPLLGEVEGAQDVIDGKSTDCTGIFTDGDQHVVVRLRRPYAAFIRPARLSSRFTRRSAASPAGSPARPPRPPAAPRVPSPCRSSAHTARPSPP